MHSQRLIDGWEHVRSGLGGVWEVWRADKLSNHFNVPWHAVSLPHCFNAEDAVDPDVTYYQGPGWYRTRLEIDNPYENGRTLLHFEGAGQKTDVYVHTHKVGSHLGGYDEFTVDLTEGIQTLEGHPLYPDALPVAIMCDNGRDLETIPSDVSDFNLYGGLYRYVNLVYVPAVSIQRVHIVPEPNGNLAVRARLYNPEEREDDITVSVKLYTPDDQLLESAETVCIPWIDTDELCLMSVPVPNLWSPDSPTLYRCDVTLSTPDGDTTVSERFGFRTFEFIEHGPFHLNGKRLLLNGTHRHEDHAGLAAAMTEDLIREEMQRIKAMGANFIRLGHYQQSRIVLDLCDELGLLVWEEIPWCRGGIGGEQYREQARRMLCNMIDQHHNHPSIILWGLGNENDWEADFDTFDTDDIRQFMEELNTTAHERDPSRKTAIRRCDFCKDVTDVYSPSIWAGWYRGQYVDYKPTSEQLMKEVPHFLHVEWGADNHARRHAEDPYACLRDIATGQGADERDGDYFNTGGQTRASRDGDWSETYFCDLIDWHLKEQETMADLTGTAQWSFKDFSTPVRPDNPVPYVNQKGVVERDFTPKEGYYVFQSYWSKVPMARIYGHTNPVRWGAKGETRTVKVYSNCDTAEFFLNGTSCGAKIRNSQDFPAAGLRWDVAFEPGENHLKVVAQKDGATVTDEITQIYQTDIFSDAVRLELKEIVHENDIATLEVCAYDANNVFCPNAAFFVRFALAGNGKLIDNQGTSTGSRRVQLYNGRAQISLRLNNGVSVVSVSAEGLATAFLTVG